MVAPSHWEAFSLETFVLGAFSWLVDESQLRWLTWGEVGPGRRVNVYANLGLGVWFSGRALAWHSWCSAPK
jgi:hypothetical protein